MTVKELKLILDELDPSKEIIVDYSGNTIAHVIDATEYIPGFYSDFKDINDTYKEQFVFIITELE